MYNEEQKIAFIKSYTTSINNANKCVTIFNRAEWFETELQQDICTFTEEQIKDVVQSITGIKERSRWNVVIVLKAYCRWCLANNIDGATDAVFSIKDSGTEAVKRNMVSSPVHMKAILDSYLDDGSKNNCDSIFRTYLWLAFMGVKEERIAELKKENFNFDDMELVVNGTAYPIYAESIKDIRCCVLSDAFVDRHPKHNEKLTPRVPGSIFRGIKRDRTIKQVRSEVSKVSKQAVKDGKCSVTLSYKRAFSSGLFYRMYQRELAGFPVDFGAAALDFVEGREYDFSSGRNNMRNKLTYVRTDYENDYRQWKLAFTV